MAVYNQQTWSDNDFSEIEASVNETLANQYTSNNSKDVNKGNCPSVEGKRLLDIRDIGANFPTSKEDTAVFLSLVLEDEHNQMWYEKLVKERRIDFLKNCLIETLKAGNQGRINKSKAAFFVGVIKNKTKQLERIEAYKKKHKTLFGYGGNDL